MFYGTDKAFERFTLGLIIKYRNEQEIKSAECTPESNLSVTAFLWRNYC